MFVLINWGFGPFILSIMNLNQLEFELQQKITKELLYIDPRLKFTLRLTLIYKDLSVGRQVPVLLVGGEVITNNPPESSLVTYTKEIQQIMTRLVERTIRAAIYELLYTRRVILGITDITFFSLNLKEFKIDLS